MSTETRTRRVPLLLWPFWAIWRLLAWIVGEQHAPAERECDVLALMREYERSIRRS